MGAELFPSSLLTDAPKKMVGPRSGDLPFIYPKLAVARLYDLIWLPYMDNMFISTLDLLIVNQPPGIRCLKFVFYISLR